MKKTVCITVMLAAVFASVARAQQGPVERDPFYPSAGGFTSPAPPAEEKAWGRDPFNNPLTGRIPARNDPGPVASGGMLTGIIYSTDVRLAIVGGEMFAEGGMMGGKKIVRIRSRSVVFEDAAGGQEEVFLDNFSVGK